MGAKLADDFAYPPRAMRAERAAAYLDMSPATFHRLVGEGVLPEPVRHGGMVFWDRLDLDAAFENWKSPAVNTMHELLKKME